MDLWCAACFAFTSNGIPQVRGENSKGHEFGISLSRKIIFAVTAEFCFTFCPVHFPKFLPNRFGKFSPSGINKMFGPTPFVVGSARFFAVGRMGGPAWTEGEGGTRSEVCVCGENPPALDPHRRGAQARGGHIQMSTPRI